MPDMPPPRPMPGNTDRRLAKPWWKRRPIQMGVAAAVLAVLVIAAATFLPAPNTVTVEADSLDTGQVVRAPYQDYIALRAQVVPLNVTYITAETNGRVDSVTASDGEPVVAGRVLARLANPELTLQVTSQEADISARLSDTNTQLMNLQSASESREQAIADATYALHKAQQELVKRQMLRQHGVLNDAAVQTYADEVDYQTQRVASLRASQGRETAFYSGQRQQILNSADDLRRSLEEVRKGLDALNITAPVTGRLTDFDIKPGQALKTGDPLGEVDGVGTYKLRAQVDEFYLSRLSTGLKATARVHEQTVNVRIIKVFPQVTDGHITVELEFIGAMPDLKRGETLDVRLSLGNTTQALLAPAGTWLNDTGGASIFVIRGNKADRRAITVGRRNPEFVEILSGLRAGDTVVTGGTQNLLKAQHLHLKASTKND